MSDRIERVNKVIDHLRITKHNLATTSGIAPSNFVKMMSGEQTITDKTLTKIVEAYPEISLNWLKTGEGNMVKPTDTVHQGGCHNVLQDGHAGHDLTQTNNSEKLLLEFMEGLKSQNALTEKAMSQTESAMMQTSNAMDQAKAVILQMGKTIEEISEQRKLVDRLISIIEKK